MMKLSTPPIWVFLSSTFLILAVILSKHFHVEIPVLSALVQGREYGVVLFAWAILFAGVAFKF